MYCTLTHDKLSFFRLLKFPPDLSHGPVMTVCCLAKGKLDFLSLLLFLSGSDQRFKRNGVKVSYRLIDGRLDMPKKKKDSMALRCHSLCQWFILVSPCRQADLALGGA